MNEKTSMSDPATGESPSLRTGYRPDIDGLRALAVLSVVFYHAGITCPGGFVGVDVFFVISGFLITSLITKDLESGEFRFADFWERRARRILPALFVMVAFVLAAGWFLFLPAEFENLGRSTIALALFSANVFFWREANNYFADAMEEHPLLHTWSLAVEEQFYIAVPFLMWGMFHVPQIRGRSKLLLVFLAGFAVSFGLSVYGMARFPGATFYLLPTRAWEMLLGAIVAHASFSPVEKRDRTGVTNAIHEAVAMAGLLGLLAPVFLYDAKTPFPGLTALPPCLGAGMVIWAGGRTTLVARMLSLRPLVFIGLISYSLYLWHWPLLVFYKQCLAPAPSAVAKALLVLAALVSAVVSWRFVETPFRKRAAGRSQRLVFAYSGLVLTGLLVCGTILMSTRGVPSRFGEDAMRFAQAMNDFPFSQEVSDEEIVAGNPPRIGVSSGSASPSVLVWGDSHAKAIVPAVHQLLLEQNAAGYVIAHSATPPVLNWRGGGRHSQLSKGTKYNSDAVNFIRDHKFSIVILAANWTWDEYRQANGPNDVNFERALQMAVQEVVDAGAEPWILLSVPIQQVNIAKAIERSVALPAIFDELQVCTRVSDTASDDGFAPATISALRDFGVRFVDPKPAFLDPTKTCYVVIKNDEILYKDRSHLTGKGALQMILPVLREAWAMSSKQ